MMGLDSVQVRRGPETALSVFQEALHLLTLQLFTEFVPQATEMHLSLFSPFDGDSSFYFIL
jgi:hypothetical protein